MYNDQYQNFIGKTIVISGSSKGIGKSLARTVGMLGARLVINGTNETALAKTANELRDLGIETIAVKGNVSDMDDCNRIAGAALEKYGSIDVLVANAGISAQGTLDESDPKVFKQLMDVNYLGTVYMIKACLPGLKMSKGSIVITGSASGFRGVPGHAAYSASKMALTALAEALKIELCRTGVHICLAYVGFTENDAEKTMLDATGKTILKSSVAKGNVASQLNVALQMVEMIQERKFKKIFSFLGKLNAGVVRFAPWLGDIILKRHFLKTMDAALVR